MSWQLLPSITNLDLDCSVQDRSRPYYAIGPNRLDFYRGVVGLVPSYVITSIWCHGTGHILCQNNILDEYQLHRNTTVCCQTKLRTFWNINQHFFQCFFFRVNAKMSNVSLGGWL